MMTDKDRADRLLFVIYKLSRGNTEAADKVSWEDIASEVGRLKIMDMDDFQFQKMKQEVVNSIARERMH